MFGVNEKDRDSTNAVTITNICVPNSGASNYIRQSLVDMENQMTNNIVVTGDPHTPLSQRDRKLAKKKKKSSLNHICE